MPNVPECYLIVIARGGSDCLGLLGVGEGVHYREIGGAYVVVALAHALRGVVPPKILNNASYETCAGSNTAITTSAWPVRQVHAS